MIPAGELDSPRGEERNELLRVLPDSEYARLLPRLETVPLELDQVLCEPHEPIPYIYFPENGVISMVRRMSDGATVEVGLVGRDGFLGTPYLLGTGSTLARSVVQVAGSARRMTPEQFAAALHDCPALLSVAYRYLHVLIEHISQGAACNRMHSLDARLARWLLSVDDRSDDEVLHVRHEFLAMMLGVRRAGVSVGMERLRRKGVVAYNRGKVRVLDRAGLVTAACECYEVIERERRRIFGIEHIAARAASRVAGRATPAAGVPADVSRALEKAMPARGKGVPELRADPDELRAVRARSEAVRERAILRVARAAAMLRQNRLMRGKESGHSATDLLAEERGALREHVAEYATLLRDAGTSPTEALRLAETLASAVVPRDDPIYIELAGRIKVWFTEAFATPSAPPS